MSKIKWNRFAEEIARENNTTAEAVWQEMYLAMQEGQQNPEPNARTQWAQIPRKGKELTLEEFLDYLLDESRGHRDVF